MTKRRRTPFHRRRLPLIAAIALVGSLTAVIRFTASASPPESHAGDIRVLAYNALKSDAAQTHYAEGQTFRTRSIQQDLGGDRHIRMDRFYRNLPVIGGDLVLHVDRQGRLEGTSQTLAKAPHLATAPVLSVKDSWKRAFQHTPVRGGEHSGKDSTRDARAGVRLVVWAGKKTPQLAYENVIRASHKDGTPAEVHTFIGAKSGEILGSRDRYLHERGTGNTLYSGEVKLETSPGQQGGFQLTDATRGGLTTLDANNQCAPQDPDCQSAPGGGGPTGPGGEQGGQEGEIFGSGTLPALRTAAASDAYCLEGVPVCYGTAQQGGQPEGSPPSGSTQSPGGYGDQSPGGNDDQGQGQGDYQGQGQGQGGDEGQGGDPGQGPGGDDGQGQGGAGNPLGVPGAAPVVSQDNTFGTGDDSDRSTIAADVHFGASQAWDYFLTKFGRNGFGGDGRGPTLYAHYGDQVVNAFADPQNFVAVFGDGDGNAIKPLTELDVVAHEMGHLVTLSNNALSGQGEPSALNESTSDIFGTMAEFFTNNPKDPPDFTLGESLEDNSQGGAGQLERFMDQPSKDGRSPDCFSSDVGQLDPHDGGGVSNHFFFLLANGSGESKFGNSPTCDDTQVTGIGNDAAEQIWFRAVTTYFTSDTGFKEARQGSLQAAADLFGQDSTEAQTVAKAWDAVSVPE